MKFIRIALVLAVCAGTTLRAETPDQQLARRLGLRAAYAPDVRNGHLRNVNVANEKAIAMLEAQLAGRNVMPTATLEELQEMSRMQRFGNWLKRHRLALAMSALGLGAAAYGGGVGYGAYNAYNATKPKPWNGHGKYSRWFNPVAHGRAFGGYLKNRKTDAPA